MNSDAFRQLIERMTRAIARGDGVAAAACFVSDGIYHDAFYGEFVGPAAIAGMVVHQFHGNAKDLVWSVHHAIADGDLGYASYDFSYTSKMAGSEGRRVSFAGMSRCALRGGLIARYDEIFERGLALAQLEFPEARIMKSLRRWAQTSDH